jgi:hypothetical protein
MRANVDDKCNVLTLSSPGSHRLLVFNSGVVLVGDESLRGAAPWRQEKRKYNLDSVGAYF